MSTAHRVVHRKTHHKTRRIVVLALSLLVVGTALAGCSVRVADPAAATPEAAISTSAPASSDSSPSKNAENAENTGAPDATGAAPVADDERMARLQRSRWTGSVTQHVVCADGEYTVDRNADALVVEVTGDCREIKIIASGATVLLPEVDELTVEGDGNIMILASARQVSIDAQADANLIGWENGTPAVKDAGTLNATTPIS